MIAIQDNLPVDCAVDVGFTVGELVEVEGSVPVGEIRTITTDHQTNHNDNYVNYSTLPLLNTITQKCNFLYFNAHNYSLYVPCVQHNMSGVTEPVLLLLAEQVNSFLSAERRQ